MLQDESLHLGFISGGLHYCTPKWTKPNIEFNDYYKFYFPLKGSAQVTVNGNAVPLKAPGAYFIPGHQELRNRCDKFMEVYWIHFKPKSLSLDLALSRISEIRHWPINPKGHWCQALSDFKYQFKNPSMSRYCRINALILNHLSGLIEEQKEFTTTLLAKWQPLLEYLESHFKENPNLEEISRIVRRHPNYVHRKFKEDFQVTPHRYMEKLRMELAQKLLRETDLNVAEIAQECGFDNPLYFSRNFKKFYGTSPRKIRAQLRLLMP